MGILDQDVDDKVSLAVPQLYRRGIERKEWTQLKFWIYTIDGIYQSVIVFFMAWLLFQPAVNVASNGLDVNDNRRIGVYVANATIVVVNVYILMNTYRWDWLMVTLVSFSALLIFFWTGVYSSFTASSYFYKAAVQVYAQPTFWAVTVLTVAICLLPRFACKAFQKIFLPYDVDVIREQIRQGKFKYLEEVQPGAVASHVLTLDGKLNGNGAAAADDAAPKRTGASMEEDRKPIYPPSIGEQTTATHNNRSQNGSDGTDYINARPVSVDDGERRPMSGQLSAIQSPRPLSTISVARARPSFDRLRTSMDRTRPSFESCRDMTSAYDLSRVESTHSDPNSPALTPVSTRGALSPVSTRGQREFALSPLSRRAQY